MKRLGLLILYLTVSLLPCNAMSIAKGTAKEQAPKIFIYHIPDENEQEKTETNQQEQYPDITSDDITADTSRKTEESGAFDKDDSEISKNNVLNDDYDIDDMYSDVLKGYAIYEEGEEDYITLDESITNPLAIKIQQPYNYKGGKYLASKSLSPMIYSKFSKMEYSIKPISSTHAKTIGGFTTGTMFNQVIDTAELEQSTGVYSRYDTERWGIYTAYSKTLNSTNSNYNDNLYFSPEFKLNQYFTLKEILSADITRNRKKAEFVVSINPFGLKDEDRLRIEFGANTTFDEDNEFLKNQFKFSTRFKF